MCFMFRMINHITLHSLHIVRKNLFFLLKNAKRHTQENLRAEFESNSTTYYSAEFRTESGHGAAARRLRKPKGRRIRRIILSLGDVRAPGSERSPPPSSECIAHKFSFSLLLLNRIRVHVNGFRNL